MRVETRRPSMRFLASAKDVKGGIAGVVGKEAQLFDDLSASAAEVNEFVNQLRERGSLMARGRLPGHGGGHDGGFSSGGSSATRSAGRSPRGYSPRVSVRARPRPNAVNQVWNGLHPSTYPVLAAALTVVGAPFLLSEAWQLRRRRPR